MTMTTTNNHLADVIVAQALERAGLADWIPEGEGKWSLPIQFLPDDAGWVELDGQGPLAFAFRNPVRQARTLQRLGHDHVCERGVVRRRCCRHVGAPG